jgi:hypothetical protein
MKTHTLSHQPKATGMRCAWLWAFVLTLGLLLGNYSLQPPQPAAAAGVRYAAPTTSGSGDCSSWTNACTLQTALTNAVSGDEIWVKAGVHYPGAAGNRTATFTLKNGVALYGGFAGTETARDQRDPAAHVTVLSGDIDHETNPDTVNASGVVTDTAKIAGSNAYHVVTGSSTNNTAVLDGFTITAGQANGSYPDYYGGGMLNKSGSPTLSNVTFSANSAKYGGGMLNDHSNPTLSTVIFSANSATNSGGGMYNYQSSPTLSNVTFSANSANFGGGMYNEYNSSPKLTNVTFSANSANDDGGGMYNDYSSPTLSNVTFSANSANRYGGGMYNESNSSPKLTNVTFSANSANDDGGGMYNEYNSNPTLSNVIIANSTSGGDCVGSLSGTSNHNLIEDSAHACGLTDGVDGNIIGSDPKLGALTGSPAYFPLNPGSLAIDAGDNATCAAAPVNNQSQNGVTRPQGPRCDIGSYELDYTPPLLRSITRFNPPSSPTNASTLVFRATFSEDVQNVDAADFILNATPATTATITSVTSVSPSLYEITVSGGDLATFNGVIQLDIAAGQNITDLGGNLLTQPPAQETYLVQHLLPSAPPTVSGVTATGAGTLLQGQTLASGPSQFTVTFNADVTAASAQNTANYLLVRAGGNGVQTLSCAGGVSGGDTSISIDSAVYAPATYTTILNVNGGQPLPAGLYRLFVCGTTSIVNANGEELYAGLTDFGVVFSVASSVSNFIWDGGGGDNNWSTAANWSGDAVPGATDDVYFDGTSTKDSLIDAGFGGAVANVHISSAYTGIITFGRSLAVSNNYRQDGGTVVVDPAHAFTVDGSFTHSGGTLQETRTVGASSTVTFLQIRDSGNTTDKYRGVDLDTTSSGSNLGSVTVSIRAVDTSAGEYCTSTGASSPPYARRCFTITPTNALPARVTLWALTGEVPDAVTSPSIYRHNGGTWQELANITTGTSGSYTWVSGDTPGFSAFLIAQAGGGGNAPTAVTLEAVRAHAPRATRALPLAGAGIILLGSAFIVLKRRRQQ